MAYGARSNGLRGTRPSTRRRSTRKRGVSIAKVRYQAPSARNQKSQILANAKTLAKHSRMLRTHKIYTDWQQDGGILHTTTNSWSVQRLTDFSAWQSVLRQSPVVSDKAHTFVLRLQLNMRAALNSMDYLLLNVFVVTKRKNANEFDPFDTPPALNTEYIENAQGQGMNIRLNSAVYKVHFCKYVTLTDNGFQKSAIVGDSSGNPNSTWRKWQINLPVRMSVTQPILYNSQGSWKDMHFDNLPPYHQYFLMVFAVFGGTGSISHSLIYDQLATCVNTS